MNTVFKIALFIIVSAAGYLSILLLPYMALWLHVYPDMTDAALGQFKRWYFLGSFAAFLAGVLTGTGFFFARNLVFLAAPVLMPLLWGIAVLAYFQT